MYVITIKQGKRGNKASDVCHTSKKAYTYLLYALIRND